MYCSYLFDESEGVKSIEFVSIGNKLVNVYLLVDFLYLY